MDGLSPMEEGMNALRCLCLCKPLAGSSAWVKPTRRQQNSGQRAYMYMLAVQAMTGWRTTQNSWRAWMHATRKAG